MNITKVIIEGFKAFSVYQEIPLDVEGIILIKAFNGQGKTTLFEAVTWALYGSQALNIGKEDIPTREFYRIPQFRGTRVTVFFNTEQGFFEVTRTINYKGEVYPNIIGDSSLYLAKDGELSPYRSIKDVQSQLDNYLLNYDIFKLTVFLGQEGQTFLTSSMTEKKQVLDHIFDYAWVDNAFTKTKEIYNSFFSKKEELSSQISPLQHKLENLVLKEEHAKQQYESNCLQKQTVIDFTRKSIEERKDRVIELYKRIEVISDSSEKAEILTKEYYDKWLSCQDTFRNKQIFLKNLETKILEYQKELDKIRAAEIPTICGICGTPLNEKSIEKYRENRGKDLKDINEKILNIKEDTYFLSNNIENSLKDLELISNLKEQEEGENKQKTERNAIKIQQEYSIHGLLREKETLENEITKISAELRGIEDREVKKESFIQEIASLEKSIKDKQKESLQYEDSINKIYFWVSKGFTQKGVKSYLLNNSLTALNRAVKKYASFLGWNIDLNMSMESTTKTLNITIKNSNKEEVKFETLSGGEKARIKMAVTLSLHEMLPVTTNLMVLDEPFHELDIEGIYKCFELLRLTNIKTIFVCTHTEIDALGVKVWEISKQKNGSILNF